MPRRKLSLLVLTFGLFFSAPLLAQESGAVLDLERQTLIEDVFLPSLQRIIDSLSAQGAPVPSELSDLLTQGKSLREAEDIALFEENALRYFGEEWETHLRDDSSFASPKSITLLRSRIYLSSLIANADRIAHFSTLPATDIRAEGTAVLQKLQESTTPEEEEAAMDALRALYDAIFSEGEELPSFRKDVSTLLADIVDVLPLLTGESSAKHLRSDLAELQSHLMLVNDSKQLTAWLARFDDFAERLLAHAVSTERPVLLEDITVLLDNLSSYLTKLEAYDIDTSALSEEVQALQEELPLIESDAAFEEFLTKLEHVLTVISQPAQ